MANLCVFSSFSADGFVHEYVLCLLKAIKADLGCDIVFVTTSPEFSSEQRLKVEPYVLAAYQRENENYDFGSYIDGLRTVEKWESYGNVFWINDSVYGPIYPLSECFERMSASTCDAWGMTESWQSNHYHLQSYFLCFKPSTYKPLAAFIDSYSYPDAYRDVVKQGELGLSQHMLRSGLNLLSYVSHEEVIDSVVRRKRSRVGQIVGLCGFKQLFNHLFMSNVTLLCWFDCIVNFRCPLIKIRLLRERALYKQHFSRWVKLGMPVEVLDAIRMHLAHVRQLEGFDQACPWYKNWFRRRRRGEVKRLIRDLPFELLDDES